MMAYHFCFDLNYLGWIHQDINHDLRWQTARSLILGSFLFCVGAAQALAAHQQIQPALRWRRIGKIAAAALLVSLGSGLMFPATFIWFGVLHAIAVMSLLLLGMEKMFDRLKTSPKSRVAWLLFLAPLCLLSGNFFQHPAFDTPWLAWIGFATHPPATEDYVPLLPWFGLCLIGQAVMQQRLSRSSQTAQTVFTPFTAPRWLLRVGRHSLPFYLLHQPLLLGILIPLTHFLRTPS